MPPTINGRSITSIQSERSSSLVTMTQFHDLQKEMGMLKEKQNQMVQVNQELVNLVSSLITVVQKFSLGTVTTPSAAASVCTSETSWPSISAVFNATLDVTCQPRGPGERATVSSTSSLTGSFQNN